MTRTIRRTLAQYRAEQAALNLPRIRDDALCVALAWAGFLVVAAVVWGFA